MEVMRQLRVEAEVQSRQALGLMLKMVAPSMARPQRFNQLQFVS